MTMRFGILLLPLEKLSGFRLSRYAQKSTLLALTAAMCTVGFWTADSRALGADRSDALAHRAHGRDDLLHLHARAVRDVPQIIGIAVATIGLLLVALG